MNVTAREGYCVPPKRGLHSPAYPDSPEIFTTAKTEAMRSSETCTAYTNDGVALVRPLSRACVKSVVNSHYVRIH